MKNPIIPYYFICKSCGQVEPLDRWPGLRCNHCNRKDKRIDWPEPEIKQLFLYCLSLDKSHPQFIRVSSIFLAIAFELLLEDLLLRAIWSLDITYEDGSIIVDPLIDAYQGRSRMLTLFKRVGYGSFKSHLSEINQSSFMTRWDKIVQLRNSSVHGKLKKNDRLTTKNIITVINQSLLVFSQLQNRYNKESSDYKYATENKRKYLESITKDDSAA